MRRQYGTGSLCIDSKTDKIIARIRINGKVYKKTFPKNKQTAASAWLSEMRNKVNIELDYTLGEWLCKYIENYKAPFLREKSLQRVKQAAKKFEAINSVKLSELTTIVIQSEVKKLMSTLSASSVKKSCDILNAALEQAVSEDIILKNPARTIKRPKNSCKQEVKIFTKKELGKIFYALRKLKKSKRNTSQRYDMNLFFRMLLYTGCRVSELLALRWENVDTVNHTITVAGSKDMDSQTINPPKTFSGFRTIPLLSVKTRNLLYKNKKAKGFVFENKNSGCMNYQRVFLTWENVRKLTGITLNIHTFRHTCISYLLTYGNIPIAEVAEIAGHSSPNVTLSIYTHCVQKFREKNRANSGTHLSTHS